MSIIRTLTVRNFRCFENNETFNFAAPVVVILGENGSGKTSLLEALFYATSLRSFKTRTPRECIHWGRDGYLIALTGHAQAEQSGQQETWELRAYVTATGDRAVKLNGNTVSSWHEVTAQCRAIAISEEDLALVGGAPDDRRRFLDHAISLENPEYLRQLVTLKRVVRQKNALLATGRCTFDVFVSWTEQLEALSEQIRVARVHFMTKLQDALMAQSERHQISSRATIALTYKGADRAGQSTNSDELFIRECATRRTLVGAHLDDFLITLNGQPARQFASRGQQKLIAFLLKTSVISLLSKPALILVDDFMTDFDEKNAATLLELAQKLGGQLVITAPQASCLPSALLDQIALCINLPAKNVACCKKECETPVQQ